MVHACVCTCVIMAGYGWSDVLLNILCAYCRTQYVEPGLNTLPPGKFFMLFLLSAVFFQNELIRKFLSGIRFVGPDLGPSCLLNLSADDTRIYHIIKAAEIFILINAAPIGYFRNKIRKNAYFAIRLVLKERHQRFGSIHLDPVFQQIHSLTPSTL